MVLLPRISIASRRVTVTLAAIAFIAQAARGADMQIVQFPTLHPDRITLSAALLRPEGDGPFPAVVLLHGCGGLYTAKGRMGSRERGWMETLRDDGYAVLAVDSFNPRGFRTICASDQRSITAEDDRPFDAYAALRWLRGQTYVARDRIAVMGWSHGGTTTLSTVSEATARRVGWREPGFAAAVAMYPGCLKLSRTDYATTTPILMELGLKDDWTPAKYCQRLVDRLRDRNGVIAVDGYAEAYHGFDEPTGKVHTRKVSNGRIVHVGPEPEARALATSRVSDYLAAALKD